MTVYDNLKDYLKLNKMNVITQGMKDYVEKNTLGNDYVIDEITLLTIGRIIPLSDDVMTICLGVSSTSLDKGSGSHEVYYYNVMMTGNISKGFSELHILDVGKSSSESLWAETTTSLFGLPDISYDRLEEEAEKIHSDFCRGIKRDKKHKYWFPVIDVKEKYKKTVNMHMWPADLGENIMGEIRFEESFATIYDVDYPFKPHANYHIPANTILLNVKYYRNESKTYDDIITATHELIHWELHQEYFKIRQLLDGRMIPMQCSENPVKFDKNMSDKDKALWYAEWQANELAIRVAMPKHLLENAVEEYENTVNQARHVINSKLPHDGIYYRNMIERLSRSFNVPPGRLRKRFRQLGYDFADGFRYEDEEEFIAFCPLSYVHDSLKRDETFIIDSSNYERLLKENRKFSDLIKKGYFVYTGYVVCINHPKFIKPQISYDIIKYELSNYGREHAEECCYKFKYTYISSHNTFAKYTISQYLCKLEDIEITITTDQCKNGIHINAKQFKMICDKIKEDEKKAEKTNARMILDDITTFSDSLKYHKSQIRGLTYSRLEKEYGIPVDTLKAYVAPETSKRHRKPLIEHMMILCHAFRLPHDIAVDFLTKAGTPLEKSDKEHKLYDDLLRLTDMPINVWNEYLVENGAKPLISKD